jgi:dihydrofolate reductase
MSTISRGAFLGTRHLGILDSPQTWAATLAFLTSPSSLQSAEWNNSTIIGPYGAQAIRDVKERLDGDLYVSGGGTLVRAMLADGLVDELHLFVFPLTLGAGQRLFAQMPAPARNSSSPGRRRTRAASSI